MKFQIAKLNKLGWEITRSGHTSCLKYDPYKGHRYQKYSNSKIRADTCEFDYVIFALCLIRLVCLLKFSLCCFIVFFLLFFVLFSFFFLFILLSFFFIVWLFLFNSLVQLFAQLYFLCYLFLRFSILRFLLLLV